MTTTAYGVSSIKRQRATKAEVETRRKALLDIIDDGRPMTVRQVFYQATVHNLVEKAETGYAKVQTDLTLLRRAGDLPYYWLADNTRWQRKPRTFDSVEAALKETARFYRKNLWANADVYVEIWLEKDALAGVIYPITSQYDVPLMVARGYASLSFLYNAAEYINDLEIPAFIYHLGDFDPSGVKSHLPPDGHRAVIDHLNIKVEGVIASRWKPSGEGLAPPIPEFLSRVTATAGPPSSHAGDVSPEQGSIMIKPTDNVVSIAKPAEKSGLDKFKSKKAATLANIETLPTELKIHSIAEARDFVRLHHDEENWWSPELCFVNVPIKGQKHDTLHLIDEDLALQYLQPGRIQRFRLALATKPYDVQFLCKIPSRNLDNEWNRATVKACETAKKKWTIAVSRKEEGVETYKIDYAEDGAFPEPNWPNKQTLEDLILARFLGLSIEVADHPGLLRLIGAKQVNT